jgi:uncharacterized phage protein gp47/JayE
MMEIRTFDQIITSMKNYIVSHQDKLTDFNEGSVISSFDEAVAREIAMLYVKCRVGFSAYLRGLPYSVFDFKMKDGQKAAATVIFSRSVPFGYETRIPAGSIIKAGNLKFIATGTGIIEADALESGEVPVIAENTGKDYNVAQGAINAIESVLQSDVIAVNNPGPASGGIDKEDFAAYINRFGDYILGLQRTNGYGFKSGIAGTYLIRSMEIVEHFPPEEDIWNATVYLEDGSGSITPEAISKVKAIIDGDGTPENPGYRAPGINVRYLPPVQVPVSLEVEAVIRGVESYIAVADVENAARAFVNGLRIGQSVLLSDIILVLKRISYIKDARILDPVESIHINNNQIPRFLNCSVTVVQ